MPMRAEKRKKPGDKEAFRWLSCYETVCAHLSRWDLPRLIQQGNGITRIRNVFPDHVALEILRRLECIPENFWLQTAAEQDYSKNNISHSFVSTKTGNGIEYILRIFGLFYPDDLNVFSAARYTESDHIENHDDRAYVDVMMEDGGVVQCSRDVAIIYYLTKGWDREKGGILIDKETGDEYIPEFNSLIAFKIPRYHEVTPVQQPAIRWSIFGWILKPGHLYDLQLTSPDDDGGVIECDENDVLSADTCRLAQQILRSCEEQQQQKKGQKQKRKRRKSINY